MEGEAAPKRPTLLATARKTVQFVFKDKRTFKTWTRCLVVTAVSLIFLVNADLSGLLGQAAFFMAILSVMLMPTMAITMFIIVSLTLAVGMCLGWAWGCAAMAAAASVRDQARTQRELQAIQSSLTNTTSPAFQIQVALFHGSFLDARVSAVFGAFFFIGTFSLAVINAYRPKLALLTIFGTIVLDVMCSYGPLFPNPNYTIAKLFLIPTGFYLAVACVSLILVFPESLNHVYLTTLNDTLVQSMKATLSIQSESLRTDPTDKSALESLIQRGQAARAGLVGGLGAAEAQLGLVGLEFSVGRLSAPDVKVLHKNFKTLAMRLVGLLTFQTAVDNILAVNTTLDDVNNSRVTALRKTIKTREEAHGHDLTTLLPILAHAATPLLESCVSGVDLLSSWIDDCNSGRWTWLVRKPSAERIEKRRAVIVAEAQKLRTNLQTFREVERVKIIQPFEKCFDAQTGKPIISLARHAHGAHHHDFSVRALFTCFLFCDTLDAFAEALLKTEAAVENLDRQRPVPRLWMPVGIGSIGGKVKGTRGADGENVDVSPFAMGAPTDPYTFDDAVVSDSQDTLGKVPVDEGLVTTKRDPDALPAQTALGRFGLMLTGFFRFLASAKGIFALRYSVVSLALWIPSVCASSAWFTYSNRGLWALIMAQTGLSVYAGDQVAGFVIRIAGTLLGLLVGLVAWYIAAQQGLGNAAGVVIITTALASPFMLMSIRNKNLALRPLYMMMSVTTVFVVGYSWLDGHVVQTANLGIGIDVAWKRALLIIIGFTACFIVMVIPRMTSSRVYIRKTLAAVIMELSSILASEVDAFLAEERRAREGYHEKVDISFDDKEEDISPKEQRIRKFLPRMIAVATRLQEIAPSLITAKLEPQIRGKWPAAKYEALHLRLRHILGDMALLVGALTRLDTKWCSVLVHQTPFFNPNFLADTFVHFQVLSVALKTGTPLPPAMPTLRDRLLYHAGHTGRPTHEVDPQEKIDVNVIAGDGEGSVDGDAAESSVVGSDAAPQKVDGATIGFKELSLNLLMDPQLQPHSTAIVALSTIVNLVDEITSVVKDLCGETSFPSLDVLHRRWLTMEEEYNKDRV
ncbi:hypothetical protein CYLTODRAFT_435413 [Cylindrobasidium torrendii FP15055 ss-10]|uniref:ER transporter 6TM N-terminal domain-containing protein n=1 Tax=Cylindrobasidium torrendii FP15055 ss-10 TaxID=1314674 RepID=A0A0D7BLL6_9AGAR|nr:hypothetical protein CYLTODRAFT_435413 [Cylindrobasidium torrendii FP15055 ss-10]